MFKNVTLLLLQITSLSSTSALFSPASFSQHSVYNFQNLYMSKHFSTFLHFSPNRASSIVSNSKFSYFLNSVININQVDIPEYDGISDQNNNPISPRVSFVCNHTSFQRNTSPFNGAAILVHSNINSINSINALIEDTNFNENSALMGGAIFYESSSINMTYCHFKSNFAQIGSHIFLSCSSSNVISCSFQESSFNGNNADSSIELTSSESTGKYEFTDCQFFLNKGPFRVNGNTVTATLINSCFLNYDDGQYFTYNYKNVLRSLYGTITLSDVTINNRTATSQTITSELNLGSLTAASDEALASCRLIPYPTATSHYKINSEPAIFALVAIIFFVLVSIIGIFIVTCKKKKDVPPEDAVNEPLKAKN